MAHLITDTDHAFYGSSAPAWHRLGTVVAGQPTSARALELAKLDWVVGKEPAYVQTITGFKAAPDCYLTVRSDLAGADRVLGIVGARYVPIQNTEAFDFADVLVGEGGARFETAGSLRGGRTVWMLAKLPDHLRVKDDTVSQYLLLTTTHDGSGSLRAIMTPIRVVCWNTLSAAMAGAKDAISIRHTDNAKGKIVQARKILSESRESFARIGEVLNRLADTKVSRQYVTAFLKALIPTPKDAIATRAVNQRDEIRTLFAGRQIGANQEAVKGTAYGLFNAVTQYIDRTRTTRSVSGRSAAESRLDSSWFGSGAAFRQQAATLLEETLQYAGYEGDSILDLVDGPGARQSESIGSLLDSMTIADRN